MAMVGYLVPTMKNYKVSCPTKRKYHRISATEHGFHLGHSVVKCFRNLLCVFQKVITELHAKAESRRCERGIEQGNLYTVHKKTKDN
jgi:hypothetical protein